MTVYKLRPYSTADFNNLDIFRESNCVVCGHHVPIDQSLKHRAGWIHDNREICLALVKRSLIKKGKGQILDSASCALCNTPMNFDWWFKRKGVCSKCFKDGLRPWTADYWTTKGRNAGLRCTIDDSTVIRYPWYHDNIFNLVVVHLQDQVSEKAVYINVHMQYNAAGIFVSGFLCLATEDNLLLDHPTHYFQGQAIKGIRPTFDEEYDFVCDYFSHPHKHGAPGHKHICTHILNSTCRCGYDDISDSRSCMLYDQKLRRPTINTAHKERLVNGRESD